MKESVFKRLGTTKQLQYINNLEALNVQKTEMIRVLENPWISVEDIEPSDKDIVDIFYQGKRETDYRYYKGQNGYNLFDPISAGFCNLEDVKYWMPLPKPPTERT